MHRRPMLIVAILTLCAAAPLRAQSVNLAEAPLGDRCFRNEIEMSLEGKITVRQGDKIATFPHQASAKHVYVERLLDVAEPMCDKAARFYTSAERVLRFNNQAPIASNLRPERTFLVAQRTKDKIVSFSPKGTLTRDEIELTEHFDTMAVAGLLPGKAVEIGKTWSVANRVVVALCDLEGLLQQDLEAKLESVKDDVAQIAVVGKVQGVDHGSAVSMIVNASLAFDAKARRIVALEWKQTEQREQGPVNPTVSAEMTIKLSRTPIEEPEQLSKFALVPIPRTAVPPAELTNILHRDGKKRFTLNYPRDWHVVSDSAQLVMRLLDRGDLIAQVTLTPWRKLDGTDAPSLSAFAELMAKTPGWEEEKEIERKEVKNNPKGQRTIYRVASTGTLSNGASEGIRSVQYFYLIISDAGEQLIVTFSLTPQQAQRFGDRDLEFVREIAFPSTGDNNGP